MITFDRLSSGQGVDSYRCSVARQRSELAQNLAEYMKYVMKVFLGIIQAKSPFDIIPSDVRYNSRIQSKNTF